MLTWKWANINLQTFFDGLIHSGGAYMQGSCTQTASQVNGIKTTLYIVNF